MDLWRKQKKIAAAFGAFLGFMLLCTLISRAVYASGLPRVTAEYPSRMAITHKVEAEGVVQQGMEYAVHALGGLRCRAVYAHVGDQVTPETLLFEVDLEDLQEQIAGNGKSCSEMATKIQILCEQVDILNGQLDQEKQNRSLCELERQADAQRMEETENRNREYAEQNANLEARNAELETKRTELEAGNSELRIKYAEAETRNARLELRCMKAKYRSAELEVRCGELEANNSELTEKLDYAKRQDAWCKSAIYDLQMEIKRYQNSLSWRITLPLRMVRRGILAVVRGERKLIGNMVVRFRNSKGYPVLKRYIPHAVKKKLEEKYFSGQQSELLIRNSSQENDVLKIVHEFDKATGQGDKLLLLRQALA